MHEENDLFASTKRVVNIASANHHCCSDNFNCYNVTCLPSTVVCVSSDIVITTILVGGGYIKKLFGWGNKVNLSVSYAVSGTYHPKYLSNSVSSEKITRGTTFERNMKSEKNARVFPEGENKSFRTFVSQFVLSYSAENFRLICCDCW